MSWNMSLSHFWNLFDKKMELKHMCFGRKHHMHRSKRKIELVTQGVHIQLASTMPVVPISVVPELCLGSAISVSGIP